MIVMIVTNYYSLSLEHARSSEANVLKSREAYRPLAVRAAVIYRTSMLMARINPMYQWSLLQFLPVFDSSVRQSDRLESGCCVK